MSPMHDHDERTLGSLLDEWTVDEPPTGFAQAVVRAARPEGLAPSRWAPRGVVVPLLLAALLVSFGAAAFSQRMERREPKAGVLVAETQSAPRKVIALTFHAPQEVSEGEPDPVAAAVPWKPPVEPQASSSPSPSNADIPAPGPVEERPRVVHFPHCECGTSGVVCSCSD